MVKTDHKPVNAKKIASVIRKIIGSICALFGALLLILVVYQQFFSVDARYARDNLDFFISELTDTPIQKEYYPLMITIKRLITCKTYYQMTWDSSAQALLSDEEYKNPLNVLVLDANDDDIQTIYTEFRYSAAMMNLSRRGLITQEIIDEYDQYVIAADAAYTNLLRNLIILLSMSILAMAFGINLFAYTPKDQQNA